MTLRRTGAFARAFVGAVLIAGSVQAAQPMESSLTSAVDLPALLAGMAERDQVRTTALREYSSVRRYALENRKFGVTGEMTVRMTYRQPGNKAFEMVSEHGSALVRKRVLGEMVDAELAASKDAIRRATQITADNYSFRYVQMAVEGGRPCHVLAVEPREPNKFLIRGNIWVDAEDLAIIRIEGSPAKNPSFWIRSTKIVHRYEKFGAFWLAVAHVSETKARIFGHTTVTIDYTDYRINQDAATAVAASSDPANTTIQAVSR